MSEPRIFFKDNNALTPAEARLVEVYAANRGFDLQAKVRGLEAELAAERATVAAYITSSAKCEAKLMAANEALLAAEMMLSELGINASEKCQMAYDHLHRYRTSDE